jgi:hypothetical protein
MKRRTAWEVREVWIVVVASRSRGSPNRSSVTVWRFQAMVVL